MVDGLQGITVIQTATVLAGPMAARLLADWGAEVIRVERPVRGICPVSWPVPWWVADPFHPTLTMCPKISIAISKA